MQIFQPIVSSQLQLNLIINFKISCALFPPQKKINAPQKGRVLRRSQKSIAITNYYNKLKKLVSLT